MLKYIEQQIGTSRNLDTDSTVYVTWAGFVSTFDDILSEANRFFRREPVIVEGDSVIINPTSMMINLPYGLVMGGRSFVIVKRSDGRLDFYVIPSVVMEA
jgi:hypothetical protein